MDLEPRLQLAARNLLGCLSRDDGYLPYWHMAVDAKTAEGIMYYTEGPYSDRAHTSDIMLLGPMAFAYEQSGDPDILDAAYRHFRWMVDGRQCATYTHKDVFAFLPLAHRMRLLDDYKAIDVKSHVARKGKL